MSDDEQRTTPAPGGWGTPEAPGVRSSRPRKRITLRVAAPALELPTDVAGELLPHETSSEELFLPDDFAGYASAGPVSEASAVAEEPGSDDRDGWVRSRATATLPPPGRPRSDHPPVGSLPPESAESLRLISRARSVAPPPLDLAGEMHDRFALGDFTGALRSAELLLGQDASDSEAAQVAATARERLVAFHLARLGGLQAVLGLKVAGAEVRWLGLDHRAGFLLSLVDGTTTVEEVVDLSGMPRHEALRLLAELLDGGAVVRFG